VVSDSSYLFDRITKALPKELFLTVLEQFDFAFHESYRRANDRGASYKPEWVEILGRERHWNLERGLREAGAIAGLNCETPHTKPSGGRFTIVHCPEFVIGRAKVSAPTDKVRVSKYRSELALLNSFVSFKQQDLFSPSPVFSDERLFGLFIAGANPHNPAVPAFVRFAIPTHDLQGWVLNQPVEQIIAAYAAPEKAVEVIPDLATVTIKLRKPSP
jgi:hypothetical protein